MRRFFGYLVLILLLVALSTTPALADTYFIYDQYGGTWHDANKTAANPEDDLMCWAATAANVLAWGHWGTATYYTTDLIFQHIQDHWTDDTGSTLWALRWWIDGSPPPHTTYSYIDVPGGGNFYPNLNFYDYYTNYTSTPNFLATMDTLMHQGYGVAFNIRNGSAVSHFVTAWGYGYSAPGEYTGIFITDSDDGVLGLREYPLIWQNNTWFLGGGYAGYQIIGFSAIKPLHIHTPIAPSWLLFGTGVCSLLLLRRRGQKKQDSSSL